MGVWETGLPLLLPKIKAFCQHSLCSFVALLLGLAGPE